MLNDLRQILEEDNRIESDLELMMEGTDADMVDMFIDEDGEAEIPESELTKILTKIPEYNQEEELNKKLKRLTESVIPDYELLEEGPVESLQKADNIEYEEYIDSIEEQNDIEYEEESYSIFEEASNIVDEILCESKESREAKRDANMEKAYRQSAAQINTPEEIKNIIKKNKELCKQIKSAINSKEAKQEDSGKIKKLLSQFKDTILFMKYDPCNPSEDTPLYILKRNLKNNAICERVLKERLKELQKSGK